MYNFEILSLLVRTFNIYNCWHLVRGSKNHECDLTDFFTLKTVLITEGLWVFFPPQGDFILIFPYNYFTTARQQQPARNVTSRKQSIHSLHVSSNNILRRASSKSICFFHLSVQEIVPWLICSELQGIPIK